VKIALAIGVAALAMAATAFADPPARITIVSVFEPVTYGENAYENGQLLGDAQGGQLVALEQSAAPFTDWTPVAQVTSDAMGYYSFKLRPTQTMQYRTSSQGMGSERIVWVSVAPRIRLKAQAVGKTTVRFSGTVAPALPGQTIAIQRELRGGSWANVTNVRLHSGKTFAGRIRTRHSINLRAYFENDSVHYNGFSKVVKIARGAKAATATAAACARPSITRISTNPTAPLAGRGMTLRVATSLAGGRVYAIDVLWGEKDQRDHFTLAPSARKPKVVFALRHRYMRTGTYTLRVRVFGKTAGCKASRTQHPQLRVIGGISRAARPAGA
jgi:hypothetical protein